MYRRTDANREQLDRLVEFVRWLNTGGQDRLQENAVSVRVSTLGIHRNLQWRMEKAVQWEVIDLTALPEVAEVEDLDEVIHQTPTIAASVEDSVADAARSYPGQTVGVVLYWGQGGATAVDDEE